MRVRADSLHPRPDSLKASTDTVVGDSITVLGLHPGDTTTKIPKDTLKAPLAHAELPPVLGVGDQFSWNREEMFATGAITLMQLLEFVPGITTFTTGNIASPQFAAYAGNPGRVRVFLDGMEIDNLDPRAGGALEVDLGPSSPAREGGGSQGLAGDLGGEPAVAPVHHGQTAAGTGDRRAHGDSRHVEGRLDLESAVAVGVADGADASDVGDNASEHQSLS